MVNLIFKNIYSLSKKSKTPVYIVGGFVRDQILKVETKDLDFVVLGGGIEFSRKAADKLKGENFVAFEKFDTARFSADSFVLEFAGARAETYDEASRKPRVLPVNALEEDLKRRDFTINALAQELASDGLGKIIDPIGGRADLDNKIIRTPLSPDVTFRDDPLRMIRAARFAGRFNFQIDKTTYNAMKNNVMRLEIVSWERIREELDKILMHNTPSASLNILYDSGLMEYIIPELTALYGVEYVGEWGHKDQLSHSFKVLDQIAPLTQKLSLRWAALLHDIGKAPTKRFDRKVGWTFHAHDYVGQKMFGKIGHRLRFDANTIKYIQKMIRWHLRPIALCDEGVTDSAVRRLIVNLGDELDDLIFLYRADITTKNPRKLAAREKDFAHLMKRIEEVRETDKMRAFQSPVRGDEIMQLCGLKPGKQVGILKKKIEEAIIEGVIPNEYEAAKEYLMKIKDGD